MERKAVSGIMITLILTSLLTLALDTFSAKANSMKMPKQNNNPTASLDVLRAPQGYLQGRNSLHEMDLKDAAWNLRRYWSVGNEFVSRNSLSEREIETPRSRSLPNCKWDFGRAVEWRDFAYTDEDSAEVVIGVDDIQQSNYHELADYLLENGGELVDSVSIGGKIRAVVADIPFSTLHSFASRIETADFVSYIQPNMRYEVDSVPNDPEWPKQWGPAKIEADYAWNTTTGDSSVLVAIIDTGIDWNHPDLAANYVPLGYDWVNDDADPMDDNGHGTHVAGIIAAVINNGIGVAGLAQVKIMAEKGFDSGGSGNTDDLAKAIADVVDNGANIISCSWGGYTEDALLHQALKYAYDHGVLIVAAAGNDATSMKHYPSAYDEVVAVSATNEYDKPAWFSNYGDSIDLAAPGVEILSTVWDDSYEYKSGTSMACPHVSGVAALIWSQFPSMTRDQVQAQLQYTAEDLGNPSFDVYYGFGRVNARKAVEQAPSAHDLLILNWQTPPYARPGDKITIKLTILNMGMNDESDITVQLLANGNLVGSQAISFLPSGVSVFMSYLWNPVIEGTYNVTSYVVPMPGETVTENNALSRQIWVRGPIVIRVPNDYRTIQGAIDVAIDGDTLWVKAGTYYEQPRVDKSLTLIGEDKSATIIDGNEAETVVEIDAYNISVSGFTIQNGDYGVMMIASGGSNISDNIIQSNGAVGIYIRLSSCNIINGNKITDNEIYGIELSEAGNNTLRGNNMTGNRYNFAVKGEYLSDYIQDIDVSNTVNGKPIYYWVNQEQKQVPADAGYVAVINSKDIVVKDLELTNNEEGVLFLNTTNSIVKDNNITNNFDGILLFGSCNNTIESNQVTINPRVGIGIIDSGNNTIFGNKVAQNYAGVDFEYSGGNNIIGNTLTNNTKGIQDIVSDKNIFFGNLINQGLIGIDLWGSHGNIVYHNDLIGNTWQVQSEDSICAWDEGYPSAGNYWSDYKGVDEKKGPNQDQTGSDAIGDTPYIIDTYNQDRYPLWHPWTLPPAENELVVFLEAPYTLLPSYSSLLNATVVNKGLNNATNVKLLLLINSSIVESTIIPFLQVGSSYTIRYLWTPTISGECNVTAYAPPLSGEESIANNIAVKTVSVFSGTIIYVNPLENTVVLNETFTININVAAVTDLDSWQVRLYFDHTVLNLTEVRLPTDHVFNDRAFIFVGPIKGTDLNGTYIQFGAFSLGRVPGFTGSGILGQIEFKANRLGNSNLTFSRPYGEHTYLLDPDVDVIPDVTLIDGAVTVVEYLPVHDVAITDVTPSTTEVYVGQIVNITVVVKNEGNFTENFVVTCNYEREGIKHTIGTQIVTNLAPLANATITFTWTTTDITVHTMKAEILPLPGETDTADNTMTSPATVKVKILGDVNNDNKVDIKDIAQAALAFGTDPSHPRWNIQADIDQDGRVYIKDLAIIAKNFGKKYP